MSIKPKKITLRKVKPVNEGLTLEQRLNLLPAKVVRYGVGFDVHKHTIAVCVKAQLVNSSIVLIQTHIFSAHPSGIQEILSFLEKFTPISFYLMECTGVYHIPLFHALKEHFPSREKLVVAMNPLMMNRRITEFGNKNDKADANRIADLTFYDQLVKPSYIGSQSFFQTRHLMRTYLKSRSQVTRMKNRIIRNLDASNQKFPWELRYNWCLELLNWYISKDWNLLAAFEAYVQHLRDTKKAVTVILKQRTQIEPFGSITLCTETRFCIQMDLLRLAEEETFSATILKQVESWILANPDLKENYQRLFGIPGCGSITVMVLLLELGDYHRFVNWKAFCKYCGIIPNIAQSGEECHARHLNRNTNSFIREVLTQAGSNVLNQKVDCDLTQYANRIYRLKKIPYKKAMVKMAYKIARTIYAILILGITYDPKYNSSEKTQKSTRHIAIRNSYLESNRVKGLRRNIQEFLITNSEFLNSDIKHHLVQGFSQVLMKASKKSDSNDDL